MKPIIQIYFLLTSALSFAQVGIGTNNPDPDMALDVAGDIIIRDVPIVSEDTKGLRPLFINPDGTLAASQTAGRLAIYESFGVGPGGASPNLTWNSNDGINGTTINSAPIVLQEYNFTSTLNAKVMRIGLGKPIITNVNSVNNNQFNTLKYDLKIEVLDGTTVLATRTFKEFLQAQDTTPLNQGELRFFYFPFEEPAGNYTIRLTSLNRERDIYLTVDGTVRTLSMQVEKRAIFVELYSDL